jgi:hypothetical protein
MCMRVRACECMRVSACVCDTISCEFRIVWDLQGSFNITEKYDTLRYLLDFAAEHPIPQPGSNMS